MAFPISSLPRFVKLGMGGSTNVDYDIDGIIKYVNGSTYVSHDQDGVLKFVMEEEKDVTVHNQFEVEEAKAGKGLLHIKSRANNKYWVVSGSGSVLIKAAANQPNEDRLDPSCTLLEMVDSKPGSQYPYIRLRFVHSNKPLCICLPDDQNDFAKYLSIEKDEDSTLPFRTEVVGLVPIDCEAVQVPPKHHYDSFRYVVLRYHYDQHVRQTNKIENGLPDGSIRADARNALSPNCKFELERPKADDKGLCHIRSCYNNKYLTVERGIIKAMATKPNPKPEEGPDGSTKEIEHKEEYHTLFQLVHVTDDSIQLRFVHSQRLIAYSYYNGSLFELSSEEAVLSTDTELTLLDWEEFVILPRHVVFKGDNGKYLAPRVIDGEYYLKFDSSNVTDEEVIHEITYTGVGGSVRIMSKHTKMFWHAQSSYVWIRPDFGRPGGYPNIIASFLPIKTGKPNTITLRLLSNGTLCKRLSADSVTSCLAAWSDSETDKYAHLVVEEAVTKRIIKNVNYRLADARYYDETVKTMVSRESSNHNSEKETVQLRILYQQKASSTWTAGFTSTQSVEAEFKCGLPLVEDSGVKTSISFQESYSGGKTTETTSDVETTHVVTVPENSKVQVRLIATEGKCDIPFSYTVHDTLLDSTERTYEADGGVFTGKSNYNFQYDTQKLPIDDPKGFYIQGTTNQKKAV